MNTIEHHYSDYWKGRDLIVNQFGKYLVQCNKLNSSIKFSLFRHHDPVLRFLALLLHTSKIVARYVKRGVYLHYYGDMGGGKHKLDSVL